MNVKTSFRGSVAAGAAVAALAVGGSASAQEVIQLTVIDGYPPKALQVQTLIEYFIPEVDKRLAANNKYKIRWNQAFSGQIAKVRNVLPAIEAGLGDLGVVTTVFHQDKVPLQAIAYVTPFVTSDPVLVSRTFDELTEAIPAIQKDWGGFSQRVLTSFSVIDSYEMFFRDKVSDIKQFDGLKIAGAGINMRYLTGTNATPVVGSMVNYYNQLKANAIDGAMLWPEAAVAFKLVEGAPYMLQANIGTANSKAITINQAVYDRLPAEVRDTIVAVTADYRDYTAKAALNEAGQALADYKAAGGTIVPMSDAARQNWADTMPNIAKEWAAELDTKNQPGSEMLTAWMDRMRAAKQPILRQWDKE
jgi:C4-dicarboxylate-binding protein DctP